MIRPPPRSTLFPYPPLFRSVIAGACRTAIGTFGGGLKSFSAIQLGTFVIQEALKRAGVRPEAVDEVVIDRKSTRLNSSHSQISYAVFCLKKKKSHELANML